MNLALLAPGAAALALAVALGLLALAAARHPARGLERFALALGAGAALLPLLWWASGVVGLSWRPWPLRFALAAGGAVLAARALRRRAFKRQSATPSNPSAPSAPSDPPGAPDTRDPWRLAAFALLLLAIVLRLVQAGDLVAPAWVDGYHHSVITELFLRAGGVPADFTPFLEGVPFYYHFGFHALAAGAAMIASASAPTAVLATGQLLSAVTAATTWLLALRMTRSEAAAALAAAVPAAWHFFPAYYVSWARYTQLAGLVVLPVAWLLLAEAMDGGAGTSQPNDRRLAPHGAASPDRRRRAILLAGAVAAGLALLHYRVLAFYVLGALVLGLDALLRRESAGLARLVAVGAVAVTLAGGWLLGPFRRGVSRLAADTAALAADRTLSAVRPGVEAEGGLSASSSAPAWWSWGGAVDSLPSWLFTIEHNGALLVLAALGLVLALLAGRRGADALLAWLLLALLLVHPTWFGLPSSWLLPRFALAISAWLPTALALALGASVVIGGLARHGQERLPSRRSASLGRRMASIAAVLLVAGGIAAGWRLRNVANPDTVILTAPDMAAMDWVRRNTPSEATFLVMTGHWHLGSYRGLDGGYWLPLLTGRGTSMPLSFYAYGPPARAAAVRAVAEETALGDALEDGALLRLMETVGATWVYVGPASAGEAGAQSVERLTRHPRLVERFASEGVTIFELGSDGP